MNERHENAELIEAMCAASFGDRTWADRGKESKSVEREAMARALAVLIANGWGPLAALSPAPQALAGEAEWSPTGDEQASWYARMSDEDRRIANAIMREGCAEHARLTRALRDAEIASGIDIATLRARVAELEAGQDWRPIETAPRDDVVLLYGFLQPLSADKELYANLDHPRRVTGYWSPIDEAWSIIGGTWEGPFFSPTHWRPLPTPPASQEGQADAD